MSADETDAQSNIHGFLNHKSNSGGSGSRGAHLDRWTKRDYAQDEDGPHVDTFLHTKSRIIAMWRHPFPRVVEVKDKDTGEKTLQVWSGTFVSHDHESVLLKQHYLDKAGNREQPPVLCPMGRMIEAIRVAVRDGKLGWLDPVFEFRGDDPRRTQVLRAAGVYNGFKGDLTPEQKKEMKAEGVYVKDAWMQSLMARCNYLFQVVDNDNVDKGLQVAIEGTLLGERVKTVIVDAMDGKALGPQRGNPLITPYCIRWLYHPKADIKDRYHARRLEGVKLEADVRDIIFNQPPKDVAREVAPGDADELRLSVEKHWVGPDGLLDWDEIFEPAQAAQHKEEPWDEERRARKDAAKKQYESRSADKVKKSGEYGRKPEPEPEEDPEDEEEEQHNRDKAARAAEPVYECDTCQGEMRASQIVCPHCGHDYSEPEPEPEPEPKLAPRKRSDVAAGAEGRKAPPKFAADKKPAGHRVKG